MKSQTQILSWMQESLSSFVAQLSLSKSKTTVEAYQYDVRQFMGFLCECKVKRLSGLKSVHVVNYLGKCKEEGKSDSSINRYYMSIRSYCRFLRKSKLVEFDLTEDVTPPRNMQKAPRVPTVDEVQRILEQPNVETESGLRDRAILELLY